MYKPKVVKLMHTGCKEKDCDSDSKHRSKCFYRLWVLILLPCLVPLWVIRSDFVITKTKNHILWVCYSESVKQKKPLLNKILLYCILTVYLSQRTHFSTCVHLINDVPLFSFLFVSNFSSSVSFSPRLTVHFLFFFVSVCVSFGLTADFCLRAAAPQLINSTIP